jgi:hypothetical protein
MDIPHHHRVTQSPRCNQQLGVVQDHDIVHSDLLLEHLPSNSQSSHATATTRSRQINRSHAFGARYPERRERCRVSDMVSRRKKGTNLPNEYASVVGSMNNRDYEDSHNA